MNIRVKIKVVPQSGRQKIILDKSGVIKCYLNSPAEDGKANRELIKLLADELDVPQRAITIVQGLISRTKALEIEGFDSEDEVKQALGLQVQKSFC